MIFIRRTLGNIVARSDEISFILHILAPPISIVTHLPCYQCIYEGFQVVLDDAASDLPYHSYNAGSVAQVIQAGRHMLAPFVLEEGGGLVSIMLYL